MATMQPCRIGGMAMCQRRKRQLHTPDGHSSPSPAPAPASACTHGIQGKVPMPICGAEPSAPPSPPSPCMHGMATASPVSAGCRGDDDRRRHVAHPGRRPAGMPFSGDRATARINASSRARRFMWNAPGENSGGIYMMVPAVVFLESR